MDTMDRGRFRPSKAAVVPLVVLLAALALLVSACGSDDDDDKQAATPADGGAEAEIRDVKMLLSFPASIDLIPLLVAEDQGYFEDEGFRVESEATDGGGFVTQQIVAGNAQFGWAGAGSDVIAFEKDDGLRALGCNQQRNIFSIQVPEDSEVQDVEGLSGKKLGITEKGGGEEPMITAVLEEYDLTDSVEILPLGNPGPGVVRAIKAGQVDAFAAATTDMATLEAGGVALRSITPEKYDVMPGDCLISTAEALSDKENQEAAAAILRGWMKGAYFAMASPEAALEIACKAVPEQCQDKERFARPLLENAVRLISPLDTSVPPTTLDEAGWSTTAEVLAASGIVGEGIDLETLIASPETKAVQELAYSDAEALKAEAEEDAQAYTP
jgi:NitT/TauT family transport system substrate-binding protein